MNMRTQGLPNLLLAPPDGLGTAALTSVHIDGSQIIFTQEAIPIVIHHLEGLNKVDISNSNKKAPTK